MGSQGLASVTLAIQSALSCGSLQQRCRFVAEFPRHSGRANPASAGSSTGCGDRTDTLQLHDIVKKQLDWQHAFVASFDEDVTWRRRAGWDTLVRCHCCCGS